MKKALVIILGFSMLPFSPSHCKNELSSGQKVAIGTAAGAAATIGLYYGYRWYYSENTTQPAPTNPQQLQKPHDPQQTEPKKTIENKQPQESRNNVLLEEYLKQKDKEQKEHLAVLINAGKTVPSSSSEERKENQQKTALPKENLPQTNLLQPEVKTTPVSETSKPSVISLEKQPDRDYIGKIFAEHLTTIMG